MDLVFNVALAAIGVVAVSVLALRLGLRWAFSRTLRNR